MKSNMKSQISILVTLLFLAGIAVLLSNFHPVPSYMGLTAAHGSLGDAIRTGSAPVPFFSTSTRDRLAASHGFQALASYTDQGFEPVQISIKKGETVRFTNNSSHDMWAAASGSPLYPSLVNGCGSSELDSCGPIASQDFWEFTFDTAGTWEVVDNLNKSRTVTVVVK